MRILLRNPRRELEVAGPLTVAALLDRLELGAETVLVIVGDELVTRDARLDDTARVEIRPVISGGCGDRKELAQRASGRGRGIPVRSERARQGGPVISGGGS